MEVQAIAVAGLQVVDEQVIQRDLLQQPLWDEVRRSNMDKIDPATGEVMRRADGKITKPDGWLPPQLETLVGAQLNTLEAHRQKVAQQQRAGQERHRAKQAALKPPGKRGRPRKEDSPLLDTNEVAKLFGVSPKTVIAWRRESYRKRFANVPTLPVIKLGHAVRYRRDDVERFIKEQTRA